jgi:hypothetical protein
MSCLWRVGGARGWAAKPQTCSSGSSRCCSANSIGVIWPRLEAAGWNTTLSAILVEDASSGSSLIQQFKERIRVDDQVKTIPLQPA